jgi:hypothetical protein
MTTEPCIACDKLMTDGDAYYPDAGGGFIHASCCGPERESYTLNGEPLGPNDPIPAPAVWTEAEPAPSEESGTGRLGRNETSSAGEGEKLREALKPFAELVILADEEAERGDEDPLPERGSVHLLIEGEGELGNLPLSAFRRAADAYAAALASPDAVVPGGEGER